MQKPWRVILVSVTACFHSLVLHAPPEVAAEGVPEVARAPGPGADPVLKDHAGLITFLRSIRSTRAFSSELLRFAGHPSGRSWTAAPAEGGGFTVASTRRTPTKRNPYRVVATVDRIDATGKVQWTANVGDKGFVTFEVPNVLTTPDGGTLAHVLAYKHPARNGNKRFVKLDRAGRRQWAVQLPGGVDMDAPHVNFMTNGPDGSVELSGYWVRSSELTSEYDWSGHLRAWRGRLDRDGRLVESEVGEVLVDEQLKPWPTENPVGDAVAAP